MTGAGEWIADMLFRLAMKAAEKWGKPAKLDDEDPGGTRGPAEEICDDIDERIERGEL